MVVVVKKGLDKEDGERQQQLQVRQPMVPPPPLPPPPPPAPGQQRSEVCDTAWRLESQPRNLQGDIQRGRVQCPTADEKR